MREVLPGVFHWTARHPRIGIEVSSYWLEEEGVLLDPLVPPEKGLDWFAARRIEPEAIVLSNRHHYRESGRFAERFGCAVHCNSAGLHEFSDGRAVEGFEIGDVLPGSLVACEVGAICPDETALHLPEHGALAIADGIVRGGPHAQERGLGFVPDTLMDDPPATKAGLLAAYARLLDEREFTHLLLAHGGPVIGDGREQLRELLDSGGRPAFEL
jgi:hypothetical protein